MRLKINGTILNVFEAGVENYNKTRPSLIFLHYFGGSSLAWTEVIEELAKDYHCLAPDLRGFGTSDALPENYAVKDYADDVSNLISVLTIEDFVLIGHSMGGKIALALAARKPKGLHSLILLAPSPPTPEPIKEDERAKLLATHGNARVATDTVCKAAEEKLSSEVFECAVNDNLRSSDAAWRAWLERGSREDISSEVGQINVPVLVAAGEKDEIITAKLLKREIVRRVKNARLVVVSEVKHLLPLEAAAGITSLIREHCENCVGYDEMLVDICKKR
ncbi:alpha/beta hydrolase [soil metagenome]|jgi:pimeloyl-ACP methyl ester carboxylesterase|nr:alpha/beta hydrolase [Acidobacteriota bacterium]